MRIPKSIRSLPQNSVPLSRSTSTTCGRDCTPIHFPKSGDPSNDPYSDPYYSGGQPIGNGGELLLLAFRGFNPHAAKFWEWVRADSKSTCGFALRDSQRVVASDIAICDFMADSDDQEIYLQTGIRSCQTTTVIARNRNVVGMISTHWRTPHQATEDDFRLFDVLAGQAADIIERCPQDF
jgi:GAF domain-containing protein